MTENEIILAVAKISSQVAKTFNIHFKEPKVEFFEHRAIAGMASYQDYSVSFNRKLMVQEGFMNTVIHEIAHLVTDKVAPLAKQAHGPEFKSIMRALGGIPSTYHSYDVEPTKRRTVTRHVATCGCQEHLLTPQASKKAWKCKKCNVNITLTGEVRKIKP